MARTFDSLWPLTFQNPGFGQNSILGWWWIFYFSKNGTRPWDLFGSLGPIWGGALGALGPIWGARRPRRPKADIMEAEGRLNGGLGAEPPGITNSLDFFKTSVKPTKLLNLNGRVRATKQNLLQIYFSACCLVGNLVVHVATWLG